MLGFNCTISKGNLNSLADVVPLEAIQMQADTLQIQHTMFNSPERVARHNLFFTPERVNALGLDMALPSLREGGYYESEIGPEDIPRIKDSLRRAPGCWPKAGSSRRSCPTFPKNFWPPTISDLDYPFPPGCDAFWKTLRVSPDGTITPCLNFKVGNIAEQPFAEIWNGPKNAGSAAPLH